MAKIPFQLRRRSIPGAVAQPRATPDDFGASMGEGLQQFAGTVSDFAQNYLDKKFKDESDIFVSKISSEARVKFVQRAIDMRKTEESDITGLLALEFEAYRSATLAGAPNGDAARRAGMALDAIGGTIKANSIINDQVARDKRIEFQSKKSHENNLTTVFKDFKQLSILIVGTHNEVNTLELNPQTKKELIYARVRELGLNAFTGLIDRDRAGAEQALEILNDPTHRKLRALLRDNKVKLKDILNVKKRQELIKFADRAIKSHDASTRLIAADNARQRVITQRVETNRVYGLFEDMMAGGPPLTNEIIANSSLDASAKDFMRNLLIKHQAGTFDPPPSPSVQAQTYIRMLDLIKNSHMDTHFRIEEVINYNIGERLLSIGDGIRLLSRLNKPIDRLRIRFEQAIRKRITGSNPLRGITDFRGDEFAQQADRIIDDAVRDAEMREIPIYRLFDGNTEEGKELLEKLKPLIRTWTEIIGDIAAQKVPSVTPKEPFSETIDDPGWVWTTDEDKSTFKSVMDWLLERDEKPPPPIAAPLPPAEAELIANLIAELGALDIPIPEMPANSANWGAYIQTLQALRNQGKP